ncbi:MAG TPA: cation diffusion facilitator family transporter [Longimicrobiaceae bacterium]|nr:cation diffusion facilitator family transporter [Longimicrobiaceae bacterium]
MAESRTAIYASIAGDLAVAATKFAAAAVTNSSAMLSEGIHSVVDAANAALLLFGINRSQQPPDELHPFGHGQELYFWTLIVAIVIFGVGGGLSIYEGVDHILRPKPLQSAFWNYVVLGAAALFQGGASLVAFRQARDVVGERGFIEAAHETKDPTLFAVVLEDAAALGGLVVAFLGILIGHLLNEPRIDGGASIVIGLLLAAVAVFLIRESRMLLVGESADPALVAEVRRIAQADPAVDRVWPPLTLQHGPKNVLLNMEIQFRCGLSTAELTSAIDRIERSVRRRFPVVQQIFIEARSLASAGPGDLPEG